MKRIFTLLIAFISVFATTKAADVVFNVTVPSPTYECWIVGNFNGWNNNLNKMTKVDATHFTITLDDATFAQDNGVQVTTATLKYKYLSGGGDWAYVEKDAAGTELNDRTYATGTTIANPDPAKTTIPGNNGNDVVLKWAITFNPEVPAIPADILIEAYVEKAVTELYLTGSFNGWKSPGTAGTQMTYKPADSDANGNFYSLTIHTDDANKLAYKFAAGPSWAYQQKAGDMKLSDPTLKSVLHDSVPFNRIYPGASALKTVTFNVVVPVGTDSVFMMGSDFGWDGSSWKAATKNTDGTFTLSFKSDLNEYKYYSGRDWQYEEMKSDATNVSNRVADAQIGQVYNDVVAAWKKVPVKVGVPMVNMDKYTVYTYNNSIVVEGVTSKAELFDISGRNLQTVNAAGTYTSKSLNKGLYIIRIDGATMKVAVK